MRPSLLLLRLLTLWLALGVLAAVYPFTLPIWGTAAVGIAVLALVDLIVVHRSPTPDVVRIVPVALAVGNWTEVRLRLEHSGRRALALTVHDHAPGSFDVEDLPRELALKPGGWAEVPYRARPNERGTFHFGQADLLIHGPLGLMRQRRRAGEPQELRVYPDFRAVSHYAALALDNNLSQFGIHLQRRRGEGTEFYQLREYRTGDSLRQIDWKAVSRRRQLVSREYRDEQNQQVCFLLDCGRRMHTRDQGLGHFDHTLNAMLLMSYVALRQGDGVSLMTFSGQDRWLPSVRGAGAMNTVLNAVFDLKTTVHSSDYAEAATRVGLRQKRRSLVVLLTNLRDDDAEDLPRALAPIRKKHLVLLASLREPQLETALEQPVRGLDDALRVGAVSGYLEERKRVHDMARRRGVLLVDCEPANLAVSLVNKYMEIKRAGLL